ncbi:VRR-NUC domain protein [compost metagenome]
MMSQQSNSSSSQEVKSEAKLTTQVRNYLRAQKDVFFYKASDRYTQGIPDIIVCVQGRFVGIELKRTSGKPSANQLLKIKKINEAGGISDICYSLNDAIALINKARATQ